jgi:hypothetical protein
MNVCDFCSNAITRTYFRVGSVMACPECVAKESVKEQNWKWTHFRRGIAFALPAAIVAWLIKWGSNELSLLGDSSLFSFGAFLRGGATILMGVIVGSAAKAGSKNRNTRALQVSSVLLTYLAYAMAVVPSVLEKMPSSKITLPYLTGLLLIAAPISPFLALFRSPLAITGLIVLFVSLMNVWKATATAPEVTIDGPFDSTDQHSEKPMVGVLNLR